MTGIINLKRRLTRTRFVDALPAIAFILAALMATGFTIVYQIQWRATYERQADHHAEAVIALSRAALIDGSIETRQEDLRAIAPGGVVITTVNGDLYALVDGPRLFDEGRTYPVFHNERQIADIVIVPALPFKPPMPYPLMIFLVFACALIVAWLVRRISLLAAQNLDRVSTYIDQYDLKKIDKLEVPSILFREFRNLNAVALRTTRRLKGEILRFRDLARLDERTGLPNRYDFDQHLQRAITAATEETPYTVLMIRLQNWPSQRHRFSFEDAETALRLIGERISACGEHPDIKGHGLLIETSARTGEQTFAVLVSGLTGRDDVSMLVRVFRHEMVEPVEVNGVVLHPEISAAIAMIPEDGDTVQRVTHALQITLQNISDNDQTGFRFYSPKLDRQNEARRRLEKELREAVQNEAFVPVYQPKIDLKTGMIHGVEALARWQLPNGRLASPFAFISLAEELGLINEIGLQILRKSTLEAATWNKMGYNLNLAVNVSPTQFQDQYLSHKILKTLASSGLPPRQLELEITESVAVQNPDMVRAILSPLRKLGVRLAVDDFGTGHSNLAILTQFRFDTFKIDRQFIEGTPHDPQANAIVSMMMGMARSLDMLIVGEGIETQKQAEYLARSGCDIGQGYYFSKPVSAEQIRALLKGELVRRAS